MKTDQIIQAIIEGKSVPSSEMTDERVLKEIRAHLLDVRTNVSRTIKQINERIELNQRRKDTKFYAA